MLKHCPRARLGARARSPTTSTTTALPRGLHQAARRCRCGATRRSTTAARTTADSAPITSSTAASRWSRSRDACNLRCPICYAKSGPERQQQHRPLELVEAMLDAVVANEGEPDVVQISGGEPTIHPDFFAILDAAKRRPIRHLMVNTNGVRIAREPEFAERLASYKPVFEIYLQFDSLRSRAAGSDLAAAICATIRMQALERLNALDISTTLVVTLQRGVNDDEIGEILDFALKQPCVRGVTLQPVQVAGTARRLRRRREPPHVVRGAAEGAGAVERLRARGSRPGAVSSRLALHGIRVQGRRRGRPADVAGRRDALIDGSRNTIIFEQDPATRRAFLSLFSTALGSDSQPQKLKDLLCCLPRVQGDVGYANVFRAADRRVHRRAVVRSPLGEEELHPHRASGRATDPVRYVQFLLPGRSRGDAARAAARRNGEVMDGVEPRKVSWFTVLGGVCLAHSERHRRHARLDDCRDGSRGRDRP